MTQSSRKASFFSPRPPNPAPNAIERNARPQTSPGDSDEIDPIIGEMQAAIDRGDSFGQIVRLVRHDGRIPDKIFLTQLDDVIKYRDKGGRGARAVSRRRKPTEADRDGRRDRPVPSRPTPTLATGRGRDDLMENLDAVARGAADVPTFGWADEAAAGLDTMFKGSTYEDNLRAQRGVDKYDEIHNPWARLGGQVLASARMPSFGALGAVELGLLGGGYGIGHGLGSGEGGLIDRIGNGLDEGSAGFLASYGLGRATPALGQSVDDVWRRVRPASGGIPLVGPVMDWLATQAAKAPKVRGAAKDAWQSLLETKATDAISADQTEK